MRLGAPACSAGSVDSRVEWWEQLRCQVLVPVSLPIVDAPQGVACS
jgi:hypothetical protein